MTAIFTTTDLAVLKVVRVHLDMNRPLYPKKQFVHIGNKEIVPNRIVFSDIWI